MSACSQQNAAQRRCPPATLRRHEQAQHRRAGRRRAAKEEGGGGGGIRRAINLYADFLCLYSNCSYLRAARRGSQLAICDMAAPAATSRVDTRA